MLNPKHDKWKCGCNGCTTFRYDYHLTRRLIKKENQKLLMAQLSGKWKVKY